MRHHPVLPAGLDLRRRRLLASARGRVLEIGGGIGRDLPDYPKVDSVTFVEPDEVDSLSPAVFDTVVCMLVLCTVDDLDGALRAIARRLAPDGRLLFLEHVRGGGVTSVAQRVVRPAWQRFFAGCRPDRDTVAAVRAAGYLITDLDRFSMRLTVPVVSPAVQGIAKKVAG